MASVTPYQSDNDRLQPCLVIPAHDSRIRRLAYLPDGRRVVTGSDDGTVRIWNLENGEQEGTPLEHGREKICDLAVTWDGAKIISSDSKRIKVWDVDSHELVKKRTHPNGRPTAGIAIPPDDRLIAVGGAWMVTLYTMEGCQVKNPIEVGKTVNSISFSPDGKKLACGTDGDIRVYDVESGILVLGPLWVHRGLFDKVFNVLWSRDGSRLFSGLSQIICCWNVATGEQIGGAWTSHARFIRSLSLSPDGSILASASSDHTVRFWDATTGNPVGCQWRLQRVGPVNAARFSPSGEFVATAEYDGTIYFWRVPWSISIKDWVITLHVCVGWYLPCCRRVQPFLEMKIIYGVLNLYMRVFSR